MKYHLLTTFIALPLFGCSGNTLIPSHSDQISVDSVPVGASVLVLGEAMGQTPMSLSTRDVFPQSFELEKQHLYGRIQLTYPGCEPFITTVSSRIVSDGLKAELDCVDSNVPQEKASVSPQAETPPETEPSELKQRLQQLKGLFEEELISEQDYAEKRRQLLEQL
ncbi:MAG: PEGA domain-containing protein [Pseudomonadota bacterium]